ncbi:MAG: hypothetical protein FWC41_02980 [Firmicutes bacterium]|nr:hypothetical protein [Bacillota bacterium]
MKKFIVTLRNLFLLTIASISFCTASVILKKLPTCTAGLCTIKNFLATAMQPVGQTLYIWGGGWFKHEGKDGDITYGSNKIGMYPEWKEFYEKQKSDYNFCDYAISENGIAIAPLEQYLHVGLDCSGFVGWTVYNTLNTESEKSVFVNTAKTMAKIFSEKNKFGTYNDFGQIEKIRPGDIISITNEWVSSHVYIALGQCEDGSIVTIQSTPPGVRILGTQNHEGNYDSQAAKLAENYMSKYYPEWYAKFPQCKATKPNDYRKDSSQMIWEISESSIMKDPDGYRNMRPEEVLKDLFDEKS